MLEKHGVTCDDCGNYFHLGARTFKARIQEIKDAGWKVRKFFEVWCHYCPNCEPPKPVAQTERKEYWYDRL